MTSNAPFSQWFLKTWTKKGELRTTAVHRLAEASGLGSSTVWRAAVLGARIGAQPAARLAEFGGGAFSLADLAVRAPLAADIRKGDTPTALPLLRRSRKGAA